MIASKRTQFIAFVNERREKVFRGLEDYEDRVSFVTGEARQYVISNIAILDRYIGNFLNVRQSDIDAAQADKTDRESAGSRSFAKHMKPNMLVEFDSAWKMLHKYLHVDVFAEAEKGNMPKLPVVSKNGTVNYDEKNKVKEITDEKNYMVREYAIQYGPSYAPGLRFTTTPPVHEVTSKRSPVRDDAWFM